MKLDVSVIIPNFNGEEYIENCLDSLNNQSFDKNGEMEVIVVDDCSSDDSIKLIKKYENIKLIQNKRNSGFAFSVNQGIRASVGAFVLLLNNDVVVEENFVEELYGSIMGDDRTFSVSSKMIRFYERDKIDDTGDFYNVLGWAYKRGDGKKIEQYQKKTEVFSTCAGAGIYRKAILDEVGLFDETFFAYLEDVDLSYRGKIFGYKNEYEPKAICYHIGSATTASGNKYSAFKVKISARNNLYLIYKNMPIFQMIINSPFLLIGFSAKYFLFLKRGYGKEYREGIQEGFNTIRKIERTPFRIKNLKNYFWIECQLIVNLIRFIANKLM
ncbi:MAG: glycosyltransferase family 2 protein [Eubacteriaceae bacterium]